MSQLIANSSSCTTSEVSILLTSYLIAIKTMLLNITYERNGKNLFWSIYDSGEILNE